MSQFPLPMAVCAEATRVLRGSHASRELLFEAAGIPGPPPDAPHDTKWKLWLYREGRKPGADSLGMLGRVIEEFMDVDIGPFDPMNSITCEEERAAIKNTLERFGLRYYQGGRVLPIGQEPAQTFVVAEKVKPTSIEELIGTLIRGMPRAMYPLMSRRKGLTPLTFKSEYDIQDVLHAMLRVWVADIRDEEGAPSLAGSCVRMDFLLFKYEIVIETKVVRDQHHVKKVKDELIIDIEHYRKHPHCKVLWCVVYDPERWLGNPAGFVTDLEGTRTKNDGSVSVKVFVIN